MKRTVSEVLLWYWACERSLLLLALPGWVLALRFGQTAADSVPTPPKSESRQVARAETQIPAREVAQAEPPAQESQPAQTAPPGPVRQRTETTTEIEAFTEPYRDISIAASEMGTIASVTVKEGEFVKAGSVVANLDDQVLRAGLEVARGSSQATGTLKSATADLEMKLTEIAKLKELRERDHASQREVDRTMLEHQVAEARVQAVREDLEIKSLECCRIKAQIEQRVVRSPIDGVITDILKDSGEFVSPSDPVVVRVVQMDPLLIVFSVPLNQRTAIVKDQRVQMQMDRKQQPVEGIVEYVSPTADASNTSVRVKVRLPNSNGEWQAGERAVLLLRPPSPDASTADSPIASREPSNSRSH